MGLKSAQSGRCRASRSIASTAGLTVATSSTSSSPEQIAPSTAKRSSTCSKWGEVNRPVRQPASVRIVAIIVAVEPLPLVPAM
ncbi:MAG TPA: hypothetical protein DD670_10920 [Planctomycetaceae bacterium]|nr:hypothetical protein [Planctomycetaceae bacterium]